MVPTRVQGRGEFTRDHAALPRTLAQETGYMRVLLVLIQGPDLYINMACLTLPVRSAFLFVSLSGLYVSCSQNASHVLSSRDIVP